MGRFTRDEVKERCGINLSTRSIDKQFAELDAISRERRLSDQESLRLEKLVRELDARARRRKGGPAPFGDRRYGPRK